MINYTITDNNLHITDSYKVKKSEFRGVLDEIFSLNYKAKVWERSRTSMCLEWAVHNFLHSLGLWKPQTKDVDLNYPQSFWEKVGYSVAGCLCWVFVK